ncbi:MAG: carbamoyl-phosphate synthase (glutamine-hydrolyzing) large subunit [Nitrososphaerota archaeon]|nr:carbamoyl-phosphate synthase (glutamine-hydrolyzing) large subunit [Nitrososphaerota archaeon]
MIGSGAIKVGEAGEFDYSGSQCLKALKEEGVDSVLVNPNIATIQTSSQFSDRIHFVPVSVDSVTKVIEKERPDGILLGFGGQTALNCGIGLSESGVLEKYGVKVLGTPIRGIQLTEDRDLFKKTMIGCDVPVPKSFAVYNFEEAKKATDELGYPVIIRVAYTLGGKGGGVARDEAELAQIVERGLNSSIAHQVLVEEYLGGWKQIEYEIMRDRDENSVIICNMENMLGMRVHTGDNIVVAPSQTLTNSEYHTLRTASLRAARTCGIIGECNIQFALHPGSERYAAIEINARLSRSSALASKATGYPLAYIAAKLALGYHLTELKNKVSGITTALFEPSLDYLVVKMPRWDTIKFDGAVRTIGTSMKSIGEVMAIGRGFEEAIQKAARMANPQQDGVIKEGKPSAKPDAMRRIEHPTDTIAFDLAEALRAGLDEKDVASKSEVDPWFVSKFKNVVDFHGFLESQPPGSIPSRDVLTRAKKLGFSDRQLGDLLGVGEDRVREARVRLGVTPVTKVIDTLAAEWPSKTNYLYQTYDASVDEAPSTGRRKVMVLGAGPYRIGSSVEFDWGTMNMAWALRQNGFDEVVVVNCNPETVSTDFDMSDRLYFEELSVERLLAIYDKEKPEGMVLCVGGQTPNDVAEDLERRGVTILGTSSQSIETAEDRTKFSALLDRLGIPQPAWGSFRSPAEAATFCARVGYPVIVRPSHVLSGSAMRVVWDPSELETFIKRAAMVNPEYPVVVSEFIEGAREVEVDAVSDGKNTVIGAIIEHVQDAGVHSGDAIMSIPTVSITKAAKEKIRVYTRGIARELKAKGPLNIQFLVRGASVYVIECNLRASRSLPYVCKATGVNLIDVVAPVMNGGSLKRTNDVEEPKRFAVKAPQFSFLQIDGAAPKLGVEMRSTGEVACFGDTFAEALSQAFLATGHKIPKRGDVGILLLEHWQDGSGLDGLIKGFRDKGIDIMVLDEPSLKSKLDQVSSLISGGKVALVLSFNANSNVDSELFHKVRRKAVDLQVQVISTKEEAEALLLCAGP